MSRQKGHYYAIKQTFYLAITTGERHWPAAGHYWYKQRMVSFDLMTQSKHTNLKHAYGKKVVKHTSSKATPS
jgi:hypothetical protein